MTGRERFLIAINNEKPDRLPCQVHSWMQYYLNTYLDGIDNKPEWVHYVLNSSLEKNCLS